MKLAHRLAAPFALDVSFAFGTAEAYASMMFKLLPPGRLWKWIGAELQKLFLACGDELNRFDERIQDLLREAIPSTAAELLPEYERELGLPSDGTQAQRHARIVARTIARQGYRPIDFQNALAPILGLAPADVQIIETSPAEAASMGDVREVFRFHIYRDPTLPGSYSVTDAQALVDQIKPSHTVGTVIESVDFLCDDSLSLCDSDLLGA